MNQPKQILATSALLGIALLCASRPGQAQNELSSSPNPSVAGHAITLSTEACDNAKDYTVSFYYSSSPDGSPATLIASVSGFRPYTTTWTPPGAGTYYLYASAEASANCEYTSNIVTQVVDAAVSTGGPALDSIVGKPANSPDLFSPGLDSSHAGDSWLRVGAWLPTEEIFIDERNAADALALSF